MKVIYIICVLVIFSSCSENYTDEKIVGVKIYDYTDNYRTLFEKWNQIGINSVFASVKLLSDDEFKSYAQNFGIKTFAILPIFYSEEDLNADSSLFAITQNGNLAEKEWVKFICPSAEAYKNNKIKFITNFVEQHHPAGISLDFIRHFAYWEKVYPNSLYDSLSNTCFDTRCISRYLSDTKLELPQGVSSEEEVYKWIKENNFEDWVNWKCRLITDFVKRTVEAVKLIDPDIKVNLHAVPWRDEDYNGAIRKVVGQDFKALSQYVDYFSPMTYSHMTKHSPKWISSVINELYQNTGVPILPSIQVGRAYLSDRLTLTDFKECLGEAVKKPSSGVIFWNWEALDEEKQKYDLVGKMFGQHNKEN